MSATDVHSWNNLALQKAAAGGHLDVVKYIVEDIGVTAEDVRSWNNRAVERAAKGGHQEVVDYLCAAGGERCLTRQQLARQLSTAFGVDTKLYQ